MSHETLAMLLWLLLGLSVALTIVGTGTRTDWMLFFASAISFVFSILAMFSIGIFILVLAITQLVLAISLRRRRLHGQVG